MLLFIFAFLQFFAPLIRGLIDETALRDFKFPALYLAEPVLQGLKLDIFHPLEGETSFEYVADKFGNSLLQMAGNDQEFKDLGGSMIEGAKLMGEIVIGLHPKLLSQWDSAILTIHEKLIKMVDTGKEVFLPVTWTSKFGGHAVGVSLKKNGDDRFDLRMFNLGQGANFHEFRADPNGLYSALQKPYVSYIGIPLADLKESPWFVYSLAALKHHKQVPKGSNYSPDNYFYDEFLAQFDKYLKAKGDGKDGAKSLFMVSQRSGTCTVSSLVARLALSCKTHQELATLRLRLGLQIVGGWMTRNVNTQEPMKSNAGTIQLMETYPVIRKLMQYFTLALAKFAVAAILMDDESVLMAKTVLQARDYISEEQHALLQETVQICMKLLKFIKDVPLSKEAFTLSKHSSTKLFEKPLMGSLSNLDFSPFDLSFLEKNSKQLQAHENKCILTPVDAKTSNQILKMLKITSKDACQEYLVSNLMIISKSITVNVEIIQFRPRDYYKWMLAYHRISQHFQFEHAKYLDLFLPFYQLSYLSWKFVELMDSRNGRYKVNLSQFISPFEKICAEKLYKSLHNFRNKAAEQIESNAILLSAKLESEWTSFCDLIIKSNADVKPEFFDSEKMNVLNYANDYEAEIKISHRPENEIFKKMLAEPDAEMYRKVRCLAAKPYTVAFKGLLTRKISALTIKYRPFYDAIALWSFSENFFRHRIVKSSEFLPILDYEFSTVPQGFIKYFEQNDDRVGYSGSPLSFTSSVMPARMEGTDRPLLQVLAGADYCKKLTMDLLFFQDGEGVEQVMTIFEEAIEISFMSNSNFAATLDFVLVTSRRLLKKIDLRPEFAAKIIEIMHKLFAYTSKRIKDSVYDLEADYVQTGKELVELVDYSLLFARTLRTILEKDPKMAAIAQKARIIYDFWYNLVPFQQNRLQKHILDGKQFSRIHFSLANLQYLFKDCEAFTSTFKDEYYARFLAHHVAGVFNYEKKKEEWRLLDVIFDSKILSGWSNELLHDSALKKSLNLDKMHELLNLFVTEIISGSSKISLRDIGKTIVKYTVHMTDKSEKSLEIYLPAGIMFFGGSQFFPATRITNDPEFIKFFGKDLRTAFSGNFRLAPDGRHYVLIVTDYLVKGSQYACIIHNEILKIYRYVQDEWWIAPSIVKRDIYADFGHEFGIHDRRGLEIYLHLNDVYSVMWINSNSNEALYKLETSDRFIYKLYVKGLTNGKLLTIYSADASNVPRPLAQFLQRIKFVALSGTDGETIYLVQALHFLNGDGSQMPLAISLKGNVYTLLNYPNMKLADFQMLKDNNVLNGLIVDIKESETSTRQMYLMADYSYKEVKDEQAKEGMAHIITGIVEYLGNKNTNKGYTIKLVPIQQGILQPISRYDRILAAYHASFTWNFKMAIDWIGRDGLQHIEPFSLEEKTIISRFLSEPVNYPESIAIKIALLVQATLGGESFNLGWRVLETYIDVVPDISEKFHVHLLFPEILDEETFSEIFKTPLKSNHPVPGPTIKIEKIRYGYSKRQREDVDDNSVVKIDKMKKVSFYNMFEEEGNLDLRTLYSLYKSVSDGKMSPAAAKEILSFPVHVRNPKTGDSIFHYIRCLYEEIGTIKLEVETFNGFVQSSGNACSAYLCQKTRKRFANEQTPIDLIYAKYREAYAQKFGTTKRNIQPAKYLEFTLLNEKDLAAFKSASDILHNFYSVAKSGKVKCKNSKVNSRVFSDLCAAMEQSETPAVLKPLSLSDADDLKSFIKYVDDKIAALASKKEELDQKLKILSDEGSKEKVSTFRSVFMLFHNKKEKNFDNLKRCYFSNNLNCFGKKFPNFGHDNGQLEKLHQMTFDYYGAENLGRYFKVLKNLVVSITRKLQDKAHIEEVDLDIKALQNEMEKVGEMDKRAMIPGVLAYEYSSEKIRLRQEQFNDAMKLVETAKDVASDGPFKSTVIQRMMAAGKTMVLGTIASVLKANGKALSILVPPSSLYQSSAVSMQERTLKYFKVRGKTIHFSRFSFDDQNIFDTLERLKLIYSELKLVKDAENYFIAKPSELSDFHNNYVEALMMYHGKLEKGYFASGKSKLKDCLKTIGQIYRLFRDKSSIILDEIDMTMAPNLELNYPTQEKETINMDGARLTADLLLYTVHDEKFPVKLKILNNEQNNADLGIHGKTVKEAWISYVIDQLREPQSVWSAIILPSALRKEMDVESALNEIKSVLSQPKDSFKSPKLLKEWQASKSVAVRNRFHVLLVMRMQINGWLQEALGVAAFERYGPSIKNWKNIKYAIPYAAAKTPNEGSVFADRWETLNKSLIMYLLKPFGKSEVTRAVLAAIEAVSQNEIDAEALKQSFKECTGLPLNQVRVLSGKLELRDTKGQLVSLAPTFEPANAKKCSNVLKFNYVLKRIFEKLTFNTEQITSNALNMASLFKSVQGYSGTIDNINVLPLQLVSQGYQERLVNEKNNGAIALKLLKQPQKSVSEIILPASSKIKKILELMFEGVAEKEEFNAIIDVGAYFKSFRNFEVARAVVQHFEHIKVVIFYDEMSNQLHYVKKSDLADTLLNTSEADDITRITGVPVENRFTFYDQRHITGSDITQRTKAKALLTIGPKVLLRDILQGTMRLRQFMTTQSVQFILTEAVAELIRNRLKLSKDDKVGIEDIILHSSINEDVKQERENKRLAFAKIDDVVRTAVLETVQNYIEKDSLERNLKHFSAVRSLFIRSTKETPEKWIASAVEEDSAAVLKRYAQERLDFYKTAFFSETQRITVLIKDLDKLCDKPEKNVIDSRLLNFLPGKLLVRESKAGLADELGVELRMEVQVDIQEEIEMQIIQAPNMRNLGPVKVDLNPRILEMSVETVDPRLDTLLRLSQVEKRLTNEQSNLVNSEVLKLFSDFFVSFDLLLPEMNGSEAHMVDSMSQDGQAMAFVTNTKLSQLILLSAEALASILKISLSSAYMLMNEETKIWITDLSGNLISNSIPSGLTSNLLDEAAFKTPKIQQAYFHLLLFNLNFNYIFANPAMRSEFAKWLRLEGVCSIKDLTLANCLDRLKGQLQFIAQRLISFKKDKLLFERHPFVKLLLGASNGNIENYEELLMFFPLSDNAQYLKDIGFAEGSKENIWKFIPNKNSMINRDSSNSESKEDEDEQDWQVVDETKMELTADPLDSQYVIRHASVFAHPLALVAYAVLAIVAAVIGYRFWRQRQESLVVEECTPITSDLVADANQEPFEVEQVEETTETNENSNQPDDE